MKRILILTILLMSSLAWAGSTTVVVGQGGGEPAGFCSGSELFCEDFEGDDVTWDAVGGEAALDCDGYDADGDYCDDETTTYRVEGEQCFGIRGTNTYYVSEALSSANQTEFYYELWYRVTGTGTVFDGSVGVFNAAGQRIAVLYNSWGNIYFSTKGSARYPDTTVDIVANTWYHFGVYYKMETGVVNNDGIVRVWMNTDGEEFDAGDLKYSATNVDTGYTSESLGDGDEIRIEGQEAAYTCYIDDFQVVSGAPSWAYE